MCRFDNIRYCNLPSTIINPRLILPFFVGWSTRFGNLFNILSVYIVSFYPSKEYPHVDIISLAHSA